MTMKIFKNTKLFALAMTVGIAMSTIACDQGYYDENNQTYLGLESEVLFDQTTSGLSLAASPAKGQTLQVLGFESQCQSPYPAGPYFTSDEEKICLSEDGVEEINSWGPRPIEDVVKLYRKTRWLIFLNGEGAKSVFGPEGDACRDVIDANSMTAACADQMWSDAGCTTIQSHEAWINWGHHWGLSLAQLSHDFHTWATSQAEHHANACRSPYQACVGITNGPDMTEACADQLWREVGCTTENDHSYIVDRHRNWHGNAQVYHMRNQFRWVANSGDEWAVNACRSNSQCTANDSESCQGNEVHSGDLITFKGFNNRYLSIDPNGVLSTSAHVERSGSHFYVRRVDGSGLLAIGDEVTLESVHQGNVIRVEPSGDVRTEMPSEHHEEVFILSSQDYTDGTIIHDRMQLILKTYDGRLLAAEHNGTATAHRTALDSSTNFTITAEPPAHIQDSAPASRRLSDDQQASPAQTCEKYMIAGKYTGCQTVSNYTYYERDSLHGMPLIECSPSGNGTMVQKQIGVNSLMNECGKIVREEIDFQCKGLSGQEKDTCDEYAAQTWTDRMMDVTGWMTTNLFTQLRETKAVKKHGGKIAIVIGALVTYNYRNIIFDKICRKFPSCRSWDYSVGADGNIRGSDINGERYTRRPGIEQRIRVNTVQESATHTSRINSLLKRAAKAKEKARFFRKRVVKKINRAVTNFRVLGPNNGVLGELLRAAGQDEQADKVVTRIADHGIENHPKTVWNAIKWGLSDQSDATVDRLGMYYKMRAISDRFCRKVRNKVTGRMRYDRRLFEAATIKAPISIDPNQVMSPAEWTHRMCVFLESFPEGIRQSLSPEQSVFTGYHYLMPKDYCIERSGEYVRGYFLANPHRARRCMTKTELEHYSDNSLLMLHSRHHMGHGEL